jgi:AcrR family transcriptional regulator
MNGKRTYHSPLRRTQSAATRERIVTACVALTRRGADLTYAGVATEAGVQERTVYRHFPKKDDFQAALWDWIVEHLTHARLAARSEDQLVAAMRESFAGFGADALLIQAMLRSPQGLQARRRQQPARSAMFRACATQAAPAADQQVRDRAAAVLQVLYSAASWDLLHTFLDMDAAEAAATIELGIRCFLHGLQTPAAHPATSSAASSQQGGNP